MTIVSRREQYLDAGLEILADQGYGALKLAEVCHRLGVTTGSFYHRFPSWSEFTRALRRYWVDTHTEQQMKWLRDEPDPRRRLEQIAELIMVVPHRTEAAMRTWAAVDPEVQQVVTEVDQRRLDYLSTIIIGVLPDEHTAHLFARWAMYTLIGYQDALVGSDVDALAWATDRMVKLVYSAASADAD